MITLRWVRSIKVKFSIVIVAAIATAVVTSQVGYALGWPLWLRPTVAVVVSLLFVQVLAHGMTSPLRDMASAAHDIRRGGYGRRIETPSVDEVGQLAAAFNAMVADLEDADRQRRELVANVSHELRTPIAGIRAALENIRDGVVPPSDELLETIHGRVERLQRLVAELLDLSRLEAGDVTFERRRLSLADVVRGAIDEAQFDDPSVHVSFDAPVSTEMVGDPERLHQVVANLLQNATIHGAPPIGVSIVCDGPLLRMTVADAGPGLPPDAQERVFERFYRHATPDGSRPGTGLGLSIARWIVELHGGGISVAPNQPCGARFTVELPIAGFDNASS